MKRFCLIANMDKENAHKTAIEVRDYLLSKGAECEIVANSLMKDNHNLYYTDYNSIPEGTECIIVLGGDGTMIQAAHDIYKRDIPLYGINFGRIGYLTESDTERMYDDMDKLLSDHYRIEKRMMLSGVVVSDAKEYKSIVLNDYVVSKSEFGRLIAFEVYVNDTLLDSFFADGIIISTPTGSTAYNLSAGGPVIAPEMEAIAVTPICPHSLNDRSFVLSGNEKIKIRLKEGKNDEIYTAIVSSDGRKVSDIKSGDTLYVEKAEREVKIVLMENTNFYHRMRKKLSY